MADFEAPEDDVLEQEQSETDPEGPVATEKGVGLEAPEADAAEQRREVRAERGRVWGERPAEADEADAADQRTEVGIDEDDYR